MSFTTRSRFYPPRGMLHSCALTTKPELAANVPARVPCGRPSVKPGGVVWQWKGFISELPAVMSTSAARFHSPARWCSPAEPFPSANSSSCLQEAQTEDNTAAATLANSLSQQTHASSPPSSQTSSGLIFVLLPRSALCGSKSSP